jgi:uncharacterized protein (DUF2164 family)
MIELSKPVRDAATRALQAYLKDQLEVEVEGFDAVFLMDFLAETLGPAFYNQGLSDAQAIIRERLEVISDAIYELEKPIKL